MKKYLFIMVLCSIIQTSFAQSKEGLPVRQHLSIMVSGIIGLLEQVQALIFILATEIVMPTFSIGLP